MLQNRIQVLNISQNRKQSSSETVTNHNNFKITICANSDNTGGLFPALGDRSSQFLHTNNKK